MSAHAHAHTPAPTTTAPINIPMPGTRCGFIGCSKRLTLVAQSVGKCRCCAVFCTAHKDPNDHACSYDYKKEQRESLESSLGTSPCRPAKVAKI